MSMPLPIEGITDPLSIKKALARVLINQGESLANIHRKTGLASQTIQNIRDDKTEVNQELVEQLAKTEGQKLTLAIHAHLDEAMRGDKIAKLNALQNTIAVGILIEKRELLAGRATVRVGGDLSDQALRDRIEALEDDLRRQGADAIDVLPIQDGGGMEA